MSEAETQVASAEKTAFDEAGKALKPKRAKRPRDSSLKPGERYVTDGRDLLLKAVRGEISVRAPRKVSWIAKQIGTTRRVAGRFVSGRARPSLPQAIAIAALFPWIPVESWLTENERAKLFDATCTGQRIARELPPNPKTWRRHEKADERQVTLEDVLARKSAELSADMQVTRGHIDGNPGCLLTSAAGACSCNADGETLVRENGAWRTVPERTVELEPVEPELPDWID